MTRAHRGLQDLHRVFRRFFARLLGFQRPPTPGAIARMRLEELRREQSPRWEIQPLNSEGELLFGNELVVFHDEMPGRTETHTSGRIRINVNRLRG